MKNEAHTTIALKNIGMNEYGKGVYVGTHNGQNVTIHFTETDGYGDRGWVWTIGNHHAEYPVPTKREAIARMLRNAQAYGY